MTHDSRFVYIKPYTTRELRPQETDKISVDDQQFDRLLRRGEVLWVNQVFGARYAPPRQPLMAALESNYFPVLDWPVSEVKKVKDTLGDKVVVVYVEPPTLVELASRLKKRGGHSEERLAEAKAELEALACGRYNAVIDIRVVNGTDELSYIADRVCKAYLRCLDTR